MPFSVYQGNEKRSRVLVAPRSHMNLGDRIDHGVHGLPTGAEEPGTNSAQDVESVKEFVEAISVHIGEGDNDRGISECVRACLSAILAVVAQEGSLDDVASNGKRPGREDLCPSGLGSVEGRSILSFDLDPSEPNDETGGEDDVLAMKGAGDVQSVRPNEGVERGVGEDGDQPLSDITGIILESEVLRGGVGHEGEREGVGSGHTDDIFVDEYSSVTAVLAEEQSQDDYYYNFDFPDEGWLNDAASLALETSVVLQELDAEDILSGRGGADPKGGCAEHDILNRERAIGDWEGEREDKDFTLKGNDQAVVVGVGLQVEGAGICHRGDSETSDTDACDDPHDELASCGRQEEAEILGPARGCVRDVEGVVCSALAPVSADTLVDAVGDGT